MAAESTRGWAAFCTTGEPHPFISIHSVRAYRREVVREIGQIHRREGETDYQGWERAYRRGWRAVRVTITMESTDGR